jgi:hypothetical protein
LSLILVLTGLPRITPRMPMPRIHAGDLGIGAASRWAWAGSFAATAMTRSRRAATTGSLRWRPGQRR